MIYQDLLSNVYVSHKLHFYKKNQTLQKAFLISLTLREIARCHQNLDVILVTK